MSTTAFSSTSSKGKGAELPTAMLLGGVVDRLGRLPALGGNLLAAWGED